MVLALDMMNLEKNLYTQHRIHMYQLYAAVSVPKKNKLNEQWLSLSTQ